MLVALCLALAGCSTVVSGRPQPADTNGPAPVRDSALRQVLLTPAEVNKVMNAQGIKEIATEDELLSDSDFPRSCLAAWQPIQRSVYAGHDWSAVNSDALRDGEDINSADYFVIQAAVTFKSRTAATEFFDQMARDWKSCGNRQFTSTSSGGSTAEWMFGPVENANSTLAVTQKQLDVGSWGCQHALRASNNVIIDVVACSYNVVDEAKAIIDKIDAKLPSI